VEHAAFFFGVEESGKQETSIKQAASSLYLGWFTGFPQSFQTNAGIVGLKYYYHPDPYPLHATTGVFPLRVGLHNACV
jgi:hypothetical protein